MVYYRMLDPFSPETIRSRYRSILEHNSNGESCIIVGLPFSGRMGFLKAYYANFRSSFEKNYPHLDLRFGTSDSLPKMVQSKKSVLVINITGITEENSNTVIDYYNNELKANWNEDNRIVVNLYIDPDKYLFADEIREMLALCSKTFFYKSLNSEELRELRTYYEDLSGCIVSESQLGDIAGKLFSHYYLLKLFYSNSNTVSENLIEVFNKITDSISVILSIQNIRTDRILKDLGVSRDDYNRSASFILTPDSNVKVPIIPLTQKEKALIQTLRSNKAVVNKEVISEILWGAQNSELYSDWAVQKFISRVRQKMKQTTGEDILAVRGVGYRLISEEK